MKMETFFAGSGPSRYTSGSLRACLWDMISVMGARGYFDLKSRNFNPEVFNLQAISEIIVNFGESAPAALDIYRQLAEAGLVSKETLPRIRAMFMRLAFTSDEDDLRPEAMELLNKMIFNMTWSSQAAKKNFDSGKFDRLFACAQKDNLELMEKAFEKMGFEFSIEKWMEIAYMLGRYEKPPVGKEADYAQAYANLKETLGCFIASGCVDTDEKLAELIGVIKPGIDAAGIKEPLPAYVPFKTVTPENYGDLIRLFKYWGAYPSIEMKRAVLNHFYDTEKYDGTAWSIDAKTIRTVMEIFRGCPEEIPYIRSLEKALKFVRILAVSNERALTDEEIRKLSDVAIKNDFGRKPGFGVMIAETHEGLEKFVDELKSAGFDFDEQLVKTLFKADIELPSYRAYAELRRHFKGTKLEDKFDNHWIVKITDATDPIKNPTAAGSPGLGKAIYQEAVRTVIECHKTGFLGEWNEKDITLLVDGAIIECEDRIIRSGQGMDAECREKIVKQIFNEVIESVTLAQRSIDHFKKTPFAGAINATYASVVQHNMKEMFGHYLEAARRIDEAGYFDKGDFQSLIAIAFEAIETAVKDITDYDEKKYYIERSTDILLGIFKSNPDLCTDPVIKVLRKKMVIDLFKAINKQRIGKGTPGSARDLKEKDDLALLAELGSAGHFSMDKMPFITRDMEKIFELRDLFNAKIEAMMGFGALSDNIADDLIVHLFTRFEDKTGISHVEAVHGFLDLASQEKAGEQFMILYDSYHEETLLRTGIPAAERASYDHDTVTRNLAAIKAKAKSGDGKRICDLYSRIFDRVKEDKSGGLARKVLGIHVYGRDEVLIDNGLVRLGEMIRLVERPSNHSRRLSLWACIEKIMASKYPDELLTVNTDLLCAAMSFRQSANEEFTRYIFPAVFQKDAIAEDKISEIKRFIRVLSYNAHDPDGLGSAGDAIRSLSSDPIGQKMLDYRLFSNICLSRGLDALKAIEHYAAIHQSINGGKAPMILAEGGYLYQPFARSRDLRTSDGNSVMTGHFEMMREAFTKGLVDETNFNTFADIAKAIDGISSIATQENTGQTKDIVISLLAGSKKDDILKIKLFVESVLALMTAMKGELNAAYLPAMLSPLERLKAIGVWNIGHWTELFAAIAGKKAEAKDIVNELAEFVIAVDHWYYENTEIIQPTYIFNPSIMTAIIANYKLPVARTYLRPVFAKMMILLSSPETAGREEELIAEFNRLCALPEYRDSTGAPTVMDILNKAAEDLFPGYLKNMSDRVVDHVIKKSGYKALAIIRDFEDLRALYDEDEDQRGVIDDSFLFDLSMDAENNVLVPLKFMKSLKGHPEIMPYIAMKQGKALFDPVTLGKFMELTKKVSKYAIVGDNDDEAKVHIEKAFDLLGQMIDVGVLSSGNTVAAAELLGAANTNKGFISGDSYKALEDMLTLGIITSGNIAEFKDLFLLANLEFASVAGTLDDIGRDGFKIQMFSPPFFNAVIREFRNNFQEIWEETEGIITTAEGVWIDKELSDIVKITELLALVPKTVGEVITLGTRPPLREESALKMLKTYNKLAAIGVLTGENTGDFKKLMEAIFSSEGVMIPEIMKDLEAYADTLGKLQDEGKALGDLGDLVRLADYVRGSFVGFISGLGVLNAILKVWPGELPENMLKELNGNILFLKRYYASIGAYTAIESLDGYIVKVKDSAGDGRILGAMEFLEGSKRKVGDIAFAEFIGDKEVSDKGALRRSLKDKTIEDFVAGMKGDRTKLAAETPAAYAFMYFLKNIPRARGISFTEFRKVIADRTYESPSREL
ncbi:MAG: hypothetical protein HQL30_12695, partial [Candidatus Omnitrophica bacterium]|nr:hypothetical protein [Candidatus Omnitrophota bacterium]